MSQLIVIMPLPNYAKVTQSDTAMDKHTRETNKLTQVIRPCLHIQSLSVFSSLYE